MILTIIIVLAILVFVLFNLPFILTIIALALFVIVYILDEITMMLTGVKNRKWYQVTSERKYKKAFKIDVIANWLFPTFWNLIFSKTGDNYKFGVFGETLSSCFGRKKLENSLNWHFGLLIYYILYAFDYTKWREGGHCVAVIMTDEDIKKFLNK